MHIPGKYARINKVTTTYSNPVKVDDVLVVKGQVEHWMPRDASGQIHIKISSPTGVPFSYTVVDVGMTFSQQEGTKRNSALTDKKNAPTNQLESVEKKLLVLGGGSGVAATLLPAFAKEYSIKRMGRNPDKNDIVLNLETDHSLEPLREILVNENPTAILSFASLPPVKSTVANMNLNHIYQNISLHLRPLQVAAELVQQGALKNLNRFVVFGSVGARHLLPEKGFEAYAYAKSLVSYFARDLARELASKNVTVNVIAPGEIAAGMNGGLSARTMALLSAKIPQGRLTTPDDLLPILQFLLSESSQAVTGQEFIVAGGRTL